jgi:hypothetical protein
MDFIIYISEKLEINIGEQNMIRRLLPIVYGLLIVLVWSCGQQGATKGTQESGNRIVQQADGTVSLRIEKAVCYSDAANPSNNTADWNVVISKPGRFKVWLTSATKDTSRLKYSNSVKVNILDDHMEVTPSVDKIVQHAEDVPSSYFRADSYVGSFYVPEPGEYNIQVISDKVVAKDGSAKNIPHVDDTMLMSVILTPAIR